MLSQVGLGSMDYGLAMRRLGVRAYELMLAAGTFFGRHELVRYLTVAIDQSRYIFARLSAYERAWAVHASSSAPPQAAASGPGCTIAE